MRLQGPIKHLFLNMDNSLFEKGNLFRFSENGVESICRTTGGYGGSRSLDEAHDEKLKKWGLPQTVKISGVDIEVYDEKLKEWELPRHAEISQISDLEIHPDHFALIPISLDVSNKSSFPDGSGVVLRIEKKHSTSKEYKAVIRRSGDVEDFDNMAEMQNSLSKLREFFLQTTMGHL
jgi:hypothetical protein